MAIRRSRSSLSKLKQTQKRRQKARSRRDQKTDRAMQLEKLEDRHLLAGAQLTGIESSGAETVDLAGLTDLSISPAALTLKFDEGQQFDLDTLDGIRITRAGDDGLLGTLDDIQISPGFLGPNEPSQNEIVARFKESLPDDLYRIDVFARDIPSSGVVALRNVDGDPFQPAIAGADRTTIDFRLSLGAQVTAIVPQPIRRNPNGSLTHDRNLIEVYFNEEMDSTDAQNPAFYQLIFTADTADNTDGITDMGVEKPFLPNSVSYSYNATTGISKATLNFGVALEALPGLPPGVKTFRLRIGAALQSPRPPAEIDLSIEAVSDFNTGGEVELEFVAKRINAESYGTSTRVFVDEADLGATTPVAVTASDNRVFVTLNTNAGALATAQDVVDAITGDAAASSILTVSISGGTAVTPASVVVSNRGVNYSPIVLEGLGSSFATATDLDVFDIRQPDSHSKIVSSSIDPQHNPLDFPGSPDEPGHRDIPVDVNNSLEQHVNPDFGPDADFGVTTVLYNFKKDIGQSPQGTSLENFITAAQKDRIREALEIWSTKLGLQFLETESQGLTFATGDPLALDPFAPDVVNYALEDPNPNLDFIARTDPAFARGMLILDSARTWSNEAGDDYYQTAMVGIGYLLGLEGAGDLPEPTTMAFGQGLGFPDAGPPEQVAPGNHDIVHGQFLYRPDSNDIDLYRFHVDLDDAGGDPKTAIMQIETFAERQPDASLLDTLLTLYREVEVTDSTGTVVGTRREIVARNDDYYSEDSYIEVEVTTGTYFLQVTASGNSSTNPEDENTGFGGTSQGKYDLRFDLRPGVDGNQVMRDEDHDGTSTPGTPIDGDADGAPGGVHNFWFRAAPEANTIYVDKIHLPITGGGAPPAGSIANPYDEIDKALAVAAPGSIVRIVGNPGVDGNFATLTDNVPYEIGTGASAGQTLRDGRNLAVPKGVTVMIDAGAILKFNESRISVGSSNLTNDRSAGALQVLGTPELKTYFVSWFDETIGLDRHFPTTTPTPGNWGGIRFRSDLDNAEARFNYENEGIFLNYVNMADIRHGGGRLTINSVESVVQPIQMIESRPTVSFNTITLSADAAMSADPNSFKETNFHAPKFQLFNRFTSDYQRVGPELNGNTFQNNSTNALFVSIQTAAGEEPRKFTVPARFDDTDVVHVIAENLEIEGTPGAPLLDLNRPPINLVGLTPLPGSGSLNAGTYRYKLVFFDADGFEGRPSEVTVPTTLTGSGSIRVTNLPPVSSGFVGRRLYRSDSSGNGPFRLAAELNPTGTSFVDNGSLTGPVLQNDPPSVRGVTLAAAAGGTIPGGSYQYRVTFVEADGSESRASDATNTVVVAGANGTVNLAGLPTRTGLARRIYRSPAGLTTYTLVGEIPDTLAAQTTFQDDGSVNGPAIDLTRLGVVRIRPDARLRIDPGIVVKLEGARIEASFGSQFIAEGTANRGVTFTSTLDDRYGAGGTFDTTSDGDSQAPAPADWGGIYVSQAATASIDHALIAFGGGDTRIEGTFVHFNVIEVHQANLRLAHSVIENNADGIEAVGNIDTDRVGRGVNEPATIFIRASQPVLIDNIIRDNEAQALTIGVNSFTAELVTDQGRSTGFIDRDENAINRGPLVSRNILENNANNGMTIRGGILTTQAVLDDTDITHVLFEEILVPNLHTYGGLQIRSNATASLVLKMGGGGRTSAFNPLDVSSDSFDPHLTCTSILDPALTAIEDGLAATYRRAFIATGAQGVERLTNLDGSIRCTIINSARNNVTSFAPTAGITAFGSAADIDDRIGGIVQLLGEASFPVVVTSFHDDTLGAGFKLNGEVQRDTNNNADATIPQPGDYRSIRFEELSHDRNVEVILERETPNSPAPGANADPDNAQFLGELASSEKDGDDRLRLGFEVQGLLNAANDVDTYSFTADAGTEVWIDIDKTSFTLNSVVELIDSDGNVIARSDDSVRESQDPSLLFHTGAIDADAVNPLQKAPDPFQPKHLSGLPKDFFSVNPLDAGLRLVLPGVVGTRSTYHVRVRSFGLDIDDVTAGQTAGSYQMQIRLREVDEFPGSTVRNSEIRYAMNGVELVGLPVHSPLLGEAAEDENVGGPETNNHLLPNFNVPGSGPQDLGNVLATDRAVISIAGSLNLPEDVDFFKFRLDYPATGDAPITDYVSTVFDIDYANGIGRPNTNITVFDDFGRVVLFAQDSNIADDQLAPLADGDLSDLSTGSAGTRDPYIGPVSLPVGNYFVAVSSNDFVPEQLLSNPLVRREPINSIKRIVEDHVRSTQIATASSPDVSLFLDEGAIKPLDPDSVSLFVIADVEATEDESDLTAIDPRSGNIKWQHTAYAGNVEDITTRLNGSVYGFSTPDDDPTPDDFFTGLLQGVSTSSPQFVGSRDDMILTYHEDPANPGLAVRSDVGVRFNAAAYGRIGGAEVLLAVGDRGDKDLAPAGPAAHGNLLFRFDPQTGEAISAPQVKRTGSARLNGGGTDVVERGVLNTNTGGGPGGTINGLEIINGVVYALSDTGGLYVVNDPLGLSGSATLTYIRDVVSLTAPTPQFGVIHEIEPNDDPAAAPGTGNEPQNLDGEVWTQRENPDILNSKTVKHITIDSAQGDHGFLQKFVDNAIGTQDGILGGLENPQGMVIGPDGNIYITSFTTTPAPSSQVLRFNGATGEFMNVFVFSNSGGLADPRGLTFTSGGDLLVSSFGTNQVLQYDGTTGLFERVFAAVDGPTGIAQGPDGHIYVSDTTNDVINRYNGVTGAALPAPGGTGAFYAGGTTNLVPGGIAFHPVSGDLYVNSLGIDGVMRFRSPFHATPGANFPGVNNTSTAEFVPPGEAGLSGPGLGIQFNATGTELFVGSVDTDQVLRFRGPTGGATEGLAIGTGEYVTADLGGLDEPTDMRFLPSGQLLVVSANTDAAVHDPAPTAKVLRYAAGGGFDGSLVPHEGGGLDAPNDLVVGPDGHLYVTSGALSDSVLRYDGTTGAFLGDFVPDSDNNLSDPYGIAFSGTDLYVSSQGTNQVLRYDAAGNFVSVFASGAGTPRGITFDSSGNLYVASLENDSVLRYNAAGVFQGFFVPSGSGGLVDPAGIQFGPSGDLYVASEGTGEILRYNGATGAFIDAVVTGVAGLTAPADVQFVNLANDLSIVSAGNYLLVTDSASNTIFRFDGDTGTLLDSFATPGNEGLRRPVGMTFRENLSTGGGDLFVVSGATDEVFQYDVDSRATFDYYSFTVDLDDSEVVIDIDHTSPGTDTIMFLLGETFNDDFSKFAGGTGSVSSLDSLIGGSASAPLVLDAGTYILAVAEYDAFDGNAKGVDPGVPTNPLDRNDTYTLHISMTQRDDSAEGPIVVRDFEGLAARPRQTGGFENILFAIDSYGDVYSFTVDTTDPTNPALNGVPTPFFQGDDPTRLATGAVHARGLSLSATHLHVTDSRRFDPGHGLTEAFDNSTGTGPLVFPEIEPNNTFGSAHDLEQERWTLGYDSNIGDDFDDDPITINTSRFLPHVSVNGTGHGSILDGTARRDFFSFRVTEPNSYVQLELDFTVGTRLRPNRGQPGNFPDDATFPYGEGIIDAQLFLYDSEGNTLSFNDDMDEFEWGDGGSNTLDPDDPPASHEPYIDIVLQPGTYVVEVTKFDPELGQIGLPPEAGDEYTLHVSVEDHPVAPDARPDGGFSYFFGTSLGGPVTDATATSDVLITSPRHGLVGGEIVYVEGVRGIRQANGTYTVDVQDEDTFELVDADGTDEPFEPDGPYEGGGTWRLIQLPEDLKASITSSSFSLAGYAAEDKPVLYFNYLANVDPRTSADFIQVSIIDDGGTPVPLLLKADLDVVSGTTGDTNPLSPAPRDTWRQARIELDDYAGKGNLQIKFEFDTLDSIVGPFEGFFIDDFVVGFAERGEMVSNAYNDGRFGLDPDAPANEVLVGEYQLEIRRGSEYGASQFIGGRGPNSNSLELLRAFDTNDRFGQQISVNVPAGSAITEGDEFTINDGNRTVTFEFDSNGVTETPGSGNALVPYLPGDDVEQIAANLQAVINDGSVQSVLNVQAGPGGLGRVDLFGAPIVNGLTVVVHNEMGDSNAFRDQGQFLLHSNFITHSRDFGILADAAPRNSNDGSPIAFHQSHPGAARNLQNLNTGLSGGITRGVTIENNVIASEGLGGIHVSGDNGVWELVPPRPPAYPDQFQSNSTSGDLITDGAAFIVEAYGRQQRFEFEDISGDNAPAGSNVDGGDGWTPGSIPIFYRRSNGYLLLRGVGYSQAEVVYAMAAAINASPLVTNGTSQIVRATPHFSRRLGTELLGSDPALYLEGVTRVIGGPFAVSRRVPLQQGPQSFVRIVNNTIYGQDGTEAFFPGEGVDEPNDVIQEAVETHQGSGNYPRSYVSSATIGDGLSTPADRSLDIDFYKFQLDIGDRVTIDLDANELGSPLNPVLRLFNSQGIEVAISQDDPAPGEPVTFDSYLDFTATAAGSYYVGVSAANNDVYSALSLGGREEALTRGDYTIEIDVHSRHQWVLETVDGSLVADGTTIEVSDRTRTVTFELQAVGSPAVAPGNIPIVYDPTPIPANGTRGLGYRPPEMAVVIAEAINAEFPDAMLARALGGIQGQTAGGPSGTFVTNLDYNNLNFGHDYDPTRVGYGQISNNGPFATGERFVVIEGAADVRLAVNSPFRLSPDPASGNNSNQIIPERGILISERSTPTLLNNVLANLNTGVVQIDSPTTIMGASLFQNNVVDHNINPLNESFSITLPPGEPLFVNAADNNFYPEALSRIIDSSIDSLQDRATIVAITAPLGISPSPILTPDRDAAGQFRVDDPDVAPPDGFGANVFKDRGGIDRADFAGPTARLVNPLDNDVSGLDLDATETVVHLKKGPLRHISIQLEDGSDVNEVDRGSGVDDGSVTSEKVTVTANGELLTDGIDYRFDYDPLSNTIRLTHISGVWPDESVYVVTLNNTDRFVFTAPDGSQRQDGETFQIRDEFGRTVTFEYESGYRIQVPQPLALHIPAVGSGIVDGQQFTLQRPGPDIRFEFDSNVPTNVLPGNVAIDISSASTPQDIALATLQALSNPAYGLTPSIAPGDGTTIHLGAPPNFVLDLALSNLTQSGLAGVVVDGETFTMDDGVQAFTFEFEDVNGAPGVGGGNLPIPFSHAFTQDEIADAITQAIINSGINAAPTNFGDGLVHVGGVQPLTLSVAGSANLRQSGRPGVQSSTRLQLPGRLTLQVPDLLGLVGGITDGQTFTIDDGVRGASLTVDTGPNTALTISGPRAEAGVEVIFQDTLGGDVAVAFFDTINLQLLIDLDAAQTTAQTIIDAVNLEGTFLGTLDLSKEPTNNGSGIVGAAGSQGFLSTAAVFEFEDTDLADGVGVGNVAIPFTDQDSVDQLAQAIITAIANANVSLSPVYQGTGSILLNANLNHVVNTTRTVVTQSGQEGGIRDGETFTITDGTQTVTFEFDNGGGVTPGNRQVQFAPASPPDAILNSMIAAINLSNLGLNPVALLPDTIELNDTSIHSTDVSGSSLERTGVPGGAVAIPFLPDTSFDSAVFANAIITAIEASDLQGVTVSLRGGSTFFVDGAEAISGDLDQFFDGAIRDFADNELQANQASNKTQFIILMPGVGLDFGDAPDPAFPTLLQNNGARHAVVGDLFLGSGVDSEVNGLASAASDADALDDGVTFDGAFNAFLSTPITVTASDFGLLDAWIDFTRDGDFDDPGEQIFAGFRVSPGANQLTLPRPIVSSPGLTVARFRISDLGGLTPDGLAANGEVEDYQIEILPGQPPVAVNDPDSFPNPAYETHEDLAILADPGVSLLDNDSDPDGLAPTIRNPGPRTSVNGAAVVVNADGTFSYDPTAAAMIQELPVGGSLTDTFTYQAFDGLLESPTATVSIQVSGRNDIPTSMDVTGLNAVEDGATINGNFLGTDIDFGETATLQFVIVDDLPGGSGLLTNNNDGSFTFDPNAGVDFQGLAPGETMDVSFTYRAVDAQGALSNISTVTITVTGVNDAPVVQNVVVNATQGGPAVTGTFDGDDVDSDDNSGSLTYRFLPLDPPVTVEGSFQNLNNGSFTFDPGSDFVDLGVNESRSVIVFYNATDSHLASGATLATVTAIVAGINDAPVAVNDPISPGAYGTHEDAQLVVSNPANGLLVNDSDPDTNDVVVIKDAPATITSTFGATVIVQSNGTFTYDPRQAPGLQELIPGQVRDDTFVYTISDGKGGEDTATVTVRVAGRNDAPIANDMLITAIEDGPVVNDVLQGTGIDLDDDSDDLTYILLPPGPAEGTVTLTNSPVNGGFTFDPSARAPLFSDFQDLGPGETRDVFFQYRVRDPQGALSPAGTVTVRVTGVNDAPVAMDDDNVINEFNSSVIIDILRNDTDVDSTSFDLSSVVITQQPNSGTVTFNSTTGRATYTSNTGFLGTDTFKYRVSDAEGANSLQSNIATVTIHTTHLPVAGDDSVTTFSDTPITIDVLANDSDQDGTLVPGSVTIVSGPSNGTLVVQADGMVRYTPAAGYVGPDSFDYTVDDNVGATSNVATVDINVILNPTPFRNPANRLDVFPDGVITPFDALLVIAFLNNNGVGAPPPGFTPPPFVDTAPDDNIIDPRDVLAVVAELQRLASGQAEGEAEAEAEWTAPGLVVAPNLSGVDFYDSLRDDGDADRFRTLLQEEFNTPLPPPGHQGTVVDSALNAMSFVTKGMDDAELDEILAAFNDKLSEREKNQAVDDTIPLW